MIMEDTVAGQLSWVDGEQPERHGFSLCRVIDPGTANERYDLLGVIEIPLDQRHPDRVADQLHPWAVATLRAGGYGFGHYLAELTGLDSNGEPWNHISNAHISWSGTTVLVPATD
ncbi:hypothetical protein [Micromonospora sp. LOL_023]|uniref:hypothetical protein n=1 Tax=Micromonospora sp. LOL_023 TaxID=3345418 RepID=UPI003A8384F6